MLEVLLIAAAAVVAVAFAYRRAAKGRESEEAESPASAPRDVARASASRPSPGVGIAGTELVAVIAAAVSAASGMAPEAFRVVGIEALGGRGVSGGFNTPPWGFVDRLSRSVKR